VFASFYDDNTVLTGNTGNNFFVFGYGDGGGAWLQILDNEGSQNCIVSNNFIQNMYCEPSDCSNGFEVAIDATWAINDNINGNTIINPATAINLVKCEAVKWNSGCPDYNDANIDVDLTIAGNQFTNCGQIMGYTDGGWCGNLQITNNTVTNGGVNIEVTPSDGGFLRDVTINNNTFDNPNLDAFMIEIGCSVLGDALGNNISVCDNTINAAGLTTASYTIYITDMTDVNIVGNQILNSPGYTIMLATCTNSLVNSNTLDYSNVTLGNSYLGIYLNGCATVILSDNSILKFSNGNTWMAAIFINNGSAITVSGNKLVGDTNPINPNGSITGLQIINNDLSGATQVGLVDSSATNEVASGNTGYSS
jgi:hypothetical protein